MREERSVCRFCAAACGMVLSIDDENRLVRVRGDRDHQLSKGYACIKGLQAAEAANGPDRLLHPLKRQPDGSFVRIGIEQALDEIAAKLRQIIDESGPRAVAAYRGVMTAFNNVADQMLADWMVAIGSPSYFTNFTIDQSAKGVTAGRMGSWAAGHYPMDECDVMMLVGSNPVLALATSGFINFNATKQIKAARAGVMKLIVVDPRETETAHYADVHLRPWPGEDATVMAGIIRIVVTQGWHDAAFCARYVADFDDLVRAVDPFTPAFVEARAGISPTDLFAAAELFALRSSMGFGTTSTGVTMAPRSNLIDHLVQSLNVICGRYRRAGDVIQNPGVLAPRRDFRAQVIPPHRSWEKGHQGRTGFGTFGRSAGTGGTKLAEMMSCTMADEMLMPGEGQIRSLFAQAGNPLSSLPNLHKTLRAFRGLDLLVAVDPYMSSTARLAHYVLPTKTQYERSDYLLGPAYEFLSPVPFAQYAPAVTPPPEGAEVVDDWYIYWSIAKRLGIPLSFNGMALDMEVAPTTEYLLDLLVRHSQVEIGEVKKQEGGAVFDMEAQHVQPSAPGHDARFECAPPDVQAEIADTFARPPIDDEGYPFILMSRRMREVYNSFGQHFPEVRRRHPYNPLWIHPDDLASLHLEEGSRVTISSANGTIPAIVASDPTMLRGTVSMSHCWGGLPDDDRDYVEKGACTNELISVDRYREQINAMAWMSAIPVRIEHAVGASAEIAVAAE